MQYASEVEILPLPRDAMLNELLWLIIHSSWLWDCLLQSREGGGRAEGKDMSGRLVRSTDFWVF